MEFPNQGRDVLTFYMTLAMAGALLCVSCSSTTAGGAIPLPVSTGSRELGSRDIVSITIRLPTIAGASPRTATETQSAANKLMSEAILTVVQKKWLFNFVQPPPPVLLPGVHYNTLIKELPAQFVTDYNGDIPKDSVFVSPLETDLIYGAELTIWYYVNADNTADIGTDSTLYYRGAAGNWFRLRSFRSYFLAKPLAEQIEHEVLSHESRRQ